MKRHQPKKMGRSRLLACQFLWFGVTLLVAVPIGYHAGLGGADLEGTRDHLAPYHEAGPHAPPLPPLELSPRIKTLLDPLGTASFHQTSLKGNLLWTARSPIPTPVREEELLQDLAAYWSSLGAAASLHEGAIHASLPSPPLRLIAETNSQGILSIMATYRGDHAELHHDEFTRLGLPQPSQRAVVSSVSLEEERNIHLSLTFPAATAADATSYQEEMVRQGWHRVGTREGRFGTLYQRGGTLLALFETLNPRTGESTLEIILF